MVLHITHIFQVTATDLTSQDLLTIDLRVLNNPCVNQGVCEGPESDPECASTNRSTGEKMFGPSFQCLSKEKSLYHCLLLYNSEYCHIWRFVLVNLLSS